MATRPPSRFDPHRDTPAIDPTGATSSPAVGRPQGGRMQGGRARRGQRAPEFGSRSTVSQAEAERSAERAAAMQVPQHLQYVGRRGRRPLVMTNRDLGAQPQGATGASAASTVPPGWDGATGDGAANTQERIQDDAPYAEPKKLKGKKAVRAYREEQARKAREREAQLAAEANRESRGVAGFTDRTKTRGVFISNPEWTPVADYVAPEAKAPKGPKPWYQRFIIMVPIAVLTLAALGVGVVWPLIVNVQATQAADAAAAKYEQQMNGYRGAWTAERLDALTAAHPSGVLAATTDPLAQPAAASAALDNECAKLDATSRAATALAENEPPALAQMPSHALSESYRKALDADATFAAERQTAQQLLGAVSRSLPQLQKFCTNFRLGISLTNAWAARDRAELQPLRTVPKGTVMTVGPKAFPCADDAGCVNFADDKARQEYADKWKAIMEEHETALAKHHREQCWLDAISSLCALMATGAGRDREAQQDIANGIGRERVNADPGVPPFPDLTKALEGATAARTNNEHQQYLEAGKLDQKVLADQHPAWKVHMLQRMVQQFEVHLTEAAKGWRQATGV